MGDITRVVLWEQRLRGNSLRYVGVERRAGAPPLPGTDRHQVARDAMIGLAQRLSPTMPPGAVWTAKQVNGWRLDESRLAAAVAACAPGVPVVDVETGRTICANMDE